MYRIDHFLTLVLTKCGSTDPITRTLPATESLSEYLPCTGSYAGGPQFQIHGRIPKIIMIMGIRDPHFRGVPKIYDNGVLITEIESAPSPSWH